LQSPEGKELLVREFIPYLESIPSIVKREAYVEMLADTVGMRPEHIRADLERKGRTGRAPEDKSELTSLRKNKSDPRFEIEFRLMLAVFLHAGHFPFVRDHLQAEDFRDFRAKDLFLALEESFRQPGEGFEALVARIDDDTIRTLVLQKRLENEFGDRPEAFIRQGVFRLRAGVLESRRSHVEQTLKRLHHLEHQDSQMIRELLEEKMILDQTLRDLKDNERSAE
jgi:DNA primase